MSYFSASTCTIEYVKKYKSGVHFCICVVHQYRYKISKGNFDVSSQFREI
jgi:hypothetical protein